MCGLTAKALPKNMYIAPSIEIVKELVVVVQPAVVGTASSAVPALREAQPKKKVHFHGIVEVILIPCIQEYRDAEIFDSIWWVARDYREFQSTMSVAFRNFISRVECPNLKEALKMFILDELTNEHEDLIVPDVGYKRAVEHLAQETSTLGKRARV
mmetsp:Transcript_38238/g.65980  ORF Transcript_38238/g.65980 Transcript_38238/m.65980 type:complete len:156 (-) Transcript_38238:305-772(-)|eukprot:CAMPEP_0184988270 /NCGR_PEP_ID=MMETSP1098-20130426/23750_1 /TAXON_ID=89044 /ORGANISM="Spumella elongata, Strain CCAP 955/1" /LENGTH=155 /DNA_ID=CAMNT_0027512983 /DNA_START=72 /DNA_END=539 /DNA_ORIENTATION=+